MPKIKCVEDILSILRGIEADPEVMYDAFHRYIANTEGLSLIFTKDEVIERIDERVIEFEDGMECPEQLKPVCYTTAESLYNSISSELVDSMLGSFRDTIGDLVSDWMEKRLQDVNNRED